MLPSQPLSKWENGKNDPRLAIIPDILEAFPETTREYLFDTGELLKSDQPQRPLIGFPGSVFGEVEVVLRGGWSFFYTSPASFDDGYSDLREGRLLFFSHNGGYLPAILLEYRQLWVGLCLITRDMAYISLKSVEISQHRWIYVKCPHLLLVNCLQDIF